MTKQFYTTRLFKDYKKDSLYEIVKSNKDTCWVEEYINGISTGNIFKRIKYDSLRVYRNN